tara:strand:- start:140 stop:289 length:150 start_codon:yes stop_codon:yes gene_type:complete
MLPGTFFVFYWGYVMVAEYCKGTGMEVIYRWRLVVYSQFFEKIQHKTVK